MLALISPAKTLDFTETPLCSIAPTVPTFLKESNKLNKTLTNIEPSELASLMKISDKLAELNYRRNIEWKENTKEHRDSKAAVLAFQGDVYQGLDAGSMTKTDLKWAQNRLRILSGLYGILKPLDEICAYRLEMGTGLANSRGENLYGFWGDRVTDELNKTMSDSKHKTLVNLASNEYFKVVNPAKIKADVLNVNFKEKKGGQYKFISIYGKKARGLMSRFIIKNRISKLSDLKAFDYENYQFNPSLSEDLDWTFTRG